MAGFKDEPGLRFIIKDVHCPVCGSDHTRSKVHCGGKFGDEVIPEQWWYVCDEPHHDNIEAERSTMDEEILEGVDVIDLSGRWYFTETNANGIFYLEAHGKTYRLREVE